MRKHSLIFFVIQSNMLLQIVQLILIVFFNQLTPTLFFINNYNLIQKAAFYCHDINSNSWLLNQTHYLCCVSKLTLTCLNDENVIKNKILKLHYSFCNSNLNDSLIKVNKYNFCETLLRKSRKADYQEQDEQRCNKRLTTIVSSCTADITYHWPDHDDEKLVCCFPGWMIKCINKEPRPDCTEWTNSTISYLINKYEKNQSLQSCQNYQNNLNCNQERDRYMYNVAIITFTCVTSVTIMICLIKKFVLIKQFSVIVMSL